MEPKTLLTSEIDGPGVEAGKPLVRSDFLMRASTRFGVWGILGGLVASLSSAWSFPFSFGYSGILSGLGFLVGGLGVTVASALVLRETRGSLRLLSLGALVGLPFGILAALRASIVLWFPGWWMGHMGLFSLITMGAFGLGVALVILFVAGVLKNLGTKAGPEPEFE